MISPFRSTSRRLLAARLAGAGAQATSSFASKPNTARAFAAVNSAIESAPTSPWPPGSMPPPPQSSRRPPPPTKSSTTPPGPDPADALLPGQTAADILSAALSATSPRTTWTRAEIAALYHLPLFQLLTSASAVHARFHAAGEVQLCTLMNIKTGGCSEDCSYCAQSTRYQGGTGLAAKKVESVESVLEAARHAAANGATRFCMGAAWRDMRGRKASLGRIKEMIQGVRALGMEACVTLGMIDGEQAKELKSAGLTAYNHNVDTSREFYPSVISTRTYDERLNTLKHVRDAGINVCSGGILGLGEQDTDRVGLLHTVATLPAHPESFPVNALVPIKGTPLGEKEPVDFPTMVRTIATARVVMPKTIIRIAAGRKGMSEERQMLCFVAGANAIFTGEKMLTTGCNGYGEDGEMFERWGLRGMRSYGKETVEGEE